MNRQKKGAESLSQRSTPPTASQGQDGEQAKVAEGWPRRPGKNQKLMTSWKQVKKAFEERVMNCDKY